MKKYRWQIFLGLALMTASAFFYGMHYLIFKDSHHIWIYLVGDIAFVPIEVLLVTLILHELLAKREKAAKMNKLNMVIGTFFSEVGTELLDIVSETDPKSGKLTEALEVDGHWTDGDFKIARAKLAKHDYKADIGRGQLGSLCVFMVARREFMVSLLGNPLLLEHDKFTDCLWAVFHLVEELSGRKDFTKICDNDLEHIRGDINRAYQRSTRQWIDYMHHLKKGYPYLFSLAMRTNPFNPHSEIQVA
ncbi:MAG: hypothetical protein JEZ07_03605 [Phycisphaerae bacterium]|nr:hypothetical protein [Phycisphaerae bacterium]